MAEWKAKIKIKLIRSVICAPEKHKIIVRSLGLRKHRSGGRTPRRRFASGAW